MIVSRVHSRSGERIDEGLGEFGDEDRALSHRLQPRIFLERLRGDEVPACAAMACHRDWLSLRALTVLPEIARELTGWNLFHRSDLRVLRKLRKP